MLQTQGRIQGVGLGGPPNFKKCGKILAHVGANDRGEYRISKGGGGGVQVTVKY